MCVGLVEVYAVLEVESDLEDMSELQTLKSCATLDLFSEFLKGISASGQL